MSPLVINSRLGLRCLLLPTSRHPPTPTHQYLFFQNLPTFLTKYLFTTGSLTSLPTPRTKAMVPCHWILCLGWFSPAE